MNYALAITILHIKHGASKDEIKKAFRKLAHTHHPDKGGVVSKFVEIKSAYDFLLANDPPKQSGGADYGYGGYGGARWYNPITGQYEDMPPTTAKTSTRTKAESREGYYNQYEAEERDRKQKAYWQKEMKVNQMRLELKKEEFQLSMLEFELRQRGFL